MATPTDPKVLSEVVVVVRGAGRLGTAIARRLHASGFEKVACTELPAPACAHGGETFSRALTEGEVEVEGLTAKFAEFQFEFVNIWGDGMIPVFPDPHCQVRAKLHAVLIVDASRLPSETRPDRMDAALVLGVGPGYARDQVHGRIVLGGPSHGRLVLPGGPDWNATDDPTEGPPPGATGISAWARAAAGGVLEALLAFFNWNYAYKGYPRRLGEEL